MSRAINDREKRHISIFSGFRDFGEPVEIAGHNIFWQIYSKIFVMFNNFLMSGKYCILNSQSIINTGLNILILLFNRFINNLKLFSLGKYFLLLPGYLYILFRNGCIFIPQDPVSASLYSVSSDHKKDNSGNE